MKFSIDGIFAGWNTSVAGKRISFDADGCGSCGALQLQRKISRSGSRINYALEITNISDVPVNLPDIAVLDVGQPEFDVPFADMKVFKLNGLQSIEKKLDAIIKHFEISLDEEINI